MTTLMGCQTTKFDVSKACRIAPPARVEVELKPSDGLHAHVMKLIEMRGHLNASDRKFKDVSECVKELTK